jgi:hypothetical protein
VIVGRVTDGTGPLGGAAVTAKGEEGEASTTTLTKGDVGAFTLPGLGGPDTYLVTVSMDGFATQTALVTMPDAERAVVQMGVLALGRGGGSITGTVTAGEGAPLGDVQVTVTRQGVVTGSTVTDSGGSVGFYSLGGLEPPGPYVVTFAKAGFVSKSVEVSVARDAPTPVDAALVPAATSSITGLVSFAPLRDKPCGPGECALAGVTVKVTAKNVERQAMTASSPAAEVGRYTVAELTAGEYTISFAKEGFVSQTLRVTLQVGQPVNVNVTLQGQPGTVTGTASACTAVEARRRDLSELDPRKSAVPAEDGTYTLGDLVTPGEYRLVFRGPQLRTVDVTLAAGEVRSVNASCAAATTTTSSTTTSSTTTTSTSTTTTTVPQETTTTTAPTDIPQLG